MARIPALEVEKAAPAAKKILDGIKEKLGTVPNVFKTFAHSPAVLEAYMGFSGALNNAKLCPKIREQIALAVAGKNSCDYCASAHSVLGKKAGLEDAEIKHNLDGKATDEKSQAILKFVSEVLDKNARIADADVECLRKAGFSEQEIVEVVATISLNMFTNYFNHIADTEIDFPVVRTEKVAAK